MCANDAIEMLTLDLRNQDLLLTALTGVRGARRPENSDLNHIRCPLHDDSVGSVSIWMDENGFWRWKCHAGCGSGFYYNIPGIGVFDADRAILQTLTQDSAPAKTVTPVVPVMADWARDKFNERMDPEASYMLQLSRGISEEVAHYYGLGLHDGYWTIPISRPDRDEFCAVKMHAAYPHLVPKCRWFPCGTFPKEKPRHGIATLYPRPESWTPILRVFIMPGELKALRMISLGYQAVSPTSGESFSWPEREVRRLVGFRCAIVYDDDPAGRSFRDKTAKRLRQEGIPCQTLTAGRKMKNKQD